MVRPNQPRTARAAKSWGEFSCRSKLSKDKTAIVGTNGRVEIVSNVILCPCEQVKVGVAVEAVFEDARSKLTLAKFAPK